MPAKPTGIMITGPAASGKTTLGRKTAELLDFPYFDVDDFIWRFDTPEPYTVMYSREEKISRLQAAIAPYEHFVMAGSMSSFHQAFDDCFSMMVFLYVDPDIRVQRANERAIQRFGERVLEGGDMYESNQDFLRKIRRYESDGSPNLTEQKAWMESLLGRAWHSGAASLSCRGIQKPWPEPHSCSRSWSLGNL